MLKRVKKECSTRGGLVYLRGGLVYLYSGLAYLPRWSVDSSLGEWLGRASGVAAYLPLSYVRCIVLLINVLLIAGRGSASDFGLR